MVGDMVLAELGRDESADEAPSTEELVEVFMAMMRRLLHHLTERSAEFELSAPQAKAFHFLGRPRAMGELAEVLSCDASNVTGIVDRLEARGLVERRVVPDDRRVKRLVLTPEGAALWQAHHERVFADVPLVAGLSPTERRTLFELLSKSLACG
jgi:DNA-binding MarR family transcriptional regulator